MKSDFSVQTDVFEGPLELLLELIEQRKLFINDISLAQVADKYMGHIKELDSFPIKDAAQFVLVASTLLLIKSRSLLPTIELTEEEEHDIHELEMRLAMYKRMRNLSKHVSDRFGIRIIFARQDDQKHTPVFAPHKSITTPSLYRAAKNMISEFPKIEKLSRVTVEKVISLEDMIVKLRNRIQKSVQLKFSQVTNKKRETRGDKLNLIISFLAMLELVKQGVMAVQQSSMFSEIVMDVNNKE
jgi:segregation and condensation protein A